MMKLIGHITLLLHVSDVPKETVSERVLLSYCKRSYKEYNFNKPSDVRD